MKTLYSYEGTERNCAEADPLADIQTAVEAPGGHCCNTAVLPKWIIDRLKEQYACESDEELLEFVQKRIAPCIEKVICADELYQFPDVEI
jgi:hypothetical protein